MRSLLLRAWAPLLVWALGACATTEGVTSFKSGDDTAKLHDMERRVWHEANGHDTTIARSGQVYDDAPATAYVQGVMDRLYPEFKGKIVVRIHDSTQLNAFAMPNGSVYMNIGMLARIENEAQLAAVLAHEAVHFIEKHSFQQRVSSKNAAAFAVSGIPFASLAAVSSISGFSRELEREADAKGYERLVKAGYDPREAHVVFQHLADEVKSLKIEEPYFFSSHPQLTERIQGFKRLSAQHKGGGRVDALAYGNAVAAIRLDALRKDIGQNRYDSVIMVMEDPAKSRLYPPAGHYYLGEAYSRRDEKNDAGKALNAYKTAEKLAPKFAPTYMRLGMHSMKAGHKAAARRYFEQYLSLAPKDAADRGYVQQYLSSL
jgi:beta-barrel assembly-enhancing protease